MDRHPDPDVLVAQVDRELDAGAMRDVEAHLATCDECRAQVARLRSFEDLMDRVTPAGSDAIDRALDGIIDRRVGHPVTAFRQWRGLIVGATSIAAALLLWIGLRPRSEEGPREFARGTVVFESQTNDVRGAPGERFHFDLRVDRPTHLVIVEVAGRTVSMVYPHPNPVFGTFGRTTPFAAGEDIRIPPSAVADYPASTSQPVPMYFAAPSPDLATAATLEPLLAELRQAAPSGPAAVRARLAARFGSAIELPRR